MRRHALRKVCGCCTALRGPALRYWHLECTGTRTDPDPVADALKKRFRPFSHTYHVDCQPNQLRLRDGEYTQFQDIWNELAAQVRTKSSNDFVFTFLRNITPEYRQHCMTQSVNDLQMAQEQCRRLDMAARTSQPQVGFHASGRVRGPSPYRPRRSSSGHSSGSRGSYRSDRSRSRGRTPPRRSSSPFGRKDPYRSEHRRPFPPRTQQRDSNFPRKPITCWQCGKPGHVASQCWSAKNPHVKFNEGPRRAPSPYGGRPRPPPGGPPRARSPERTPPCGPRRSSERKPENARQ